MLVKINSSDMNDSYVIVAQDIENQQIIIETDTEPECEHTVVEDIPDGFMQMVHPGEYGRYMNLATIEEVKTIKDLLSSKFEKYSTIGELRAAKDSIELDLLIADLISENIELNMIVADLLTLMLGGV